jgi:hypothetical protein
METVLSESLRKGNFWGKVVLALLLGGFAKCYEGILLETKKKFAIKVIEKNSLQRSRAKQKVNTRINCSSSHR